MINIKSPAEIDKMRKAGDVLKGLFEYLEPKIRPGISTKKLDELAYDYIKGKGAIPTCLGYGGFPGTLCTSVDEVVVHGFPSEKRLEEGQIVDIDVCCMLNGWQSDAARTYLLGECSEEKQRLVKTTRESFFKGLAEFKAGNHIGDIGHAVQTYCEERGYGIVREMVGHGIGREMHEDPNVPNYGRAGHGVRLEKGMVLCIEPMVNMGTYQIITEGWKCVTKDGLPSAHYENTVALTDKGAEILTL